MKTIEARDFENDVNRYLDEVQAEAFVIVRDGKPCAVLHAVHDDVETAEPEHSPEFWQMIEERRKEPTIPWEEVKRKLGL